MLWPLLHEQKSLIFHYCSNFVWDEVLFPTSPTPSEFEHQITWKWAGNECRFLLIFIDFGQLWRCDISISVRPMCLQLSENVVFIRYDSYEKIRDSSSMFIFHDIPFISVIHEISVFLSCECVSYVRKCSLSSLRCDFMVWASHLIHDMWLWHVTDAINWSMIWRNSQSQEFWFSISIRISTR